MLSDLAHHSATVQPGAYRRYPQMFLGALHTRPGIDSAARLDPPLTEAQADLVARQWIVGDATVPE